MLFPPPINSQEMYQLCWRKCPLCLYATTIKFTVGDGERLIQVLFYTSVFPTRRVSHDFTLSLKVRGPRQACSIMKRLVHRVLGRAPGNPLARLYQTRWTALSRQSNTNLQGEGFWQIHVTSNAPRTLEDALRRCIGCILSSNDNRAELVLRLDWFLSSF